MDCRLCTITVPTSRILFRFTTIATKSPCKIFVIAFIAIPVIWQREINFSNRIVLNFNLFVSQYNFSIQMLKYWCGCLRTGILQMDIIHMNLNLVWKTCSDTNTQIIENLLNVCWLLNYPLKHESSGLFDFKSWGWFFFSKFLFSMRTIRSWSWSLIPIMVIWLFHLNEWLVII